jgi:tetratricopeptide (TPR) repeat protein
MTSNCLPHSALKQLAQDALRHFDLGDTAKAWDAVEGCLKRGYETDALQNLRGIILQGRGEPALAIEAYQRALALNPRSIAAMCGLGLALKQAGRTGDAIACWNQLIKHAPDFPDSYVALALVRIDQRQFPEAERLLRAALKADPTYAPGMQNLGFVYQLQDKLDDAVRCYEAALAMQPSSVESLINMGSVQHRLRQSSAALESFQRALALKPDSIAAQYNCAQELLLHGDFERGWALYEARFAWWKESGYQLPVFNRHRWRGENPCGLTILLVAEQGLGDTLQFIRYAPEVAALGATVVLECQPALARLLHGVHGIDRVISRGDPRPDYDFFCPLMSLPLICKTTLQSIPRRVPYIRVERELREEWGIRLGNSDALRVGLAWAGNPKRDHYQLSQSDRRRSMSIDNLAPLLSTGGIEFFNIQKDPSSSSSARSEATARIRDFPADLKDFANTAALVRHLDLVISVDTSLAHLAGALAIPVWLMCRLDGCWRWLLDREDSPWYPTMRIFRQSTQGDWDGVIQRVRTELVRYRAETT